MDGYIIMLETRHNPNSDQGRSQKFVMWGVNVGKRGRLQQFNIWFNITFACHSWDDVSSVIIIINVKKNLRV